MTEGFKLLRNFFEQWIFTNTFGKMHIEENHHGQTDPQNSPERNR